MLLKFCNGPFNSFKRGSLQRFKTFINAKAEQQNDSHIQFTEVRGQIRPKTKAERDANRIAVVEA
jgi:nitrite reductase (NADH) large subunit